MNHNILWNKYKQNPSAENRELILKQTDIDLKNCVEYYRNFYKNPQTRSKFKSVANADRLINEINKIKLITYLNNNGSEIDDSWGYVFTNDLKTIYLNYYNFFNDRINANIFDTILHEMGHLIDFHLRTFGEKPSYNEIGYLLPKTESDYYIISREEDYARVQRLRNIFKLNPIGTYDDIANKINEKLENKSFSIFNLNISISPDKKLLVVKLPKDIGTLDLGTMSYIFGNLIIDNYLATDIGYLFAKYSKQINSTTIVSDLVKINLINNTFVAKDTGFDNFA